MQFILLQDILVIFSLSVVTLYACHRLRIPPIVGFLVTGVLTGPHGFGLVRLVEAIDILAEVGVVLLLFTIGLEFSLRNLLHIRKLAFLGGVLQLSLTFGATLVLGARPGKALCRIDLSVLPLFPQQHGDRDEDSAGPRGSRVSPRPCRLGDPDLSGHHGRAHDALLPPAFRLGGKLGIQICSFFSPKGSASSCS